MKKQQNTTLISFLEPNAERAQVHCLKKETKKNCCDKINRKGKFCRKCPLINK